MIVREAIRAVVMISGIPDASLDKAAADASLDPASTYSPAQKDTINSVALTVLLNVRGLSSISEGGFSISLDKDGIEARIGFLTNNGSDARPAIKAKSIW